jgi:hypothetical protein
MLHPPVTSHTLVVGRALLGSRSMRPACRTTSAITSRRSPLWTTLLVCTACAGPLLEDVEEDDDDGAWFEVGWGAERFEPLEDGDEFAVVWGGQGAAMFPMPIRGGGFVLPDDPRDYLDERAPIMDLHVDIEGFNDGIGGWFKRIANYPVVFSLLDDGTYEFVYVAIILPDHVDPFDIDGLPATLWVQLRPYEREPMVRELDLIVRVIDNRGDPSPTPPR